ncbi:Zn(II)2Cys6 transcription factor [Aspergillus bombycis]|uniref:Zn(II)2Cys6 transcription factor n=1 Tax=Aspergillus bombycis TaxID=109264 RepID=A0A1F8A1I5_9EURO|nr:Zn(II)2Cys6 transcription factor [Aspergillus bombycis]OGM45582.1 Zn(II)2Cys6 transcription factor [Aspergillus bombycis]
MYGSHPHSNSSNQQTSGPPVPEWRLPSAAQQRPSRKPTPGPTPPPPPPSHPPLSASSYNPSTYGSISSPLPGAGASGSPAPGSAGMDTSAWGVKYNRQQYPIYAPPPLPPRPPSTPAYSSSAQSPIVSPLDNKPLPANPTYGPPTSAAEYQPQWTTNAPHASQPPVISPLSPPPPPPVPIGYQSSITQQGNQTSQQLSPPPYSVHPPGEIHNLQNSSAQQHAPFSSTNVSSPQPTLSGQGPLTAANPVPCGGALPVTAPPVPPKTSHNALPTNTSVLGSGGLSDWEHFTPTPGDVDDVEAFGNKQGNAAQSSATPEPSPGYSAPIPTVTSNSQAVISTPSANVSPISQPVHTQDTTAAQPFPGNSSAIHGIQDPPRPIRTDTSGSILESARYHGHSTPNLSSWPKHQSRTDSPTPMQKLSPLEIPKIKQDFSIQRKEVQSGSNTPRSSNTPNETSAKVDVLSPQLKLLDPYEDLDPWSKSSLERYVAMLRKEAVADSDMERFKIFTAFMSKETKLREILYNIEHEPKNEEAPSQKPTPASQEPNRQSGNSTPPIESGLIPAEPEESCEGSAGVSEDLEDGGYSPGGRPILTRVETPSTLGIQRPASQPPGKGYSSGHQSQSQPLRATSVPPSMLDKQELSPLTTNPPQPIYTPFRYTEGPQRGSDHLVIDRPAYQAYSALRQASAESGRVMSNAPHPGSHEDSHSSTPLAGNDDETFIGLIREKSVAYRKASRRKSSPPPLPASLRKGRPDGPVDDLRSMISSPLAKQSESSWHITTRKDLEKYSKDFGYIQETVRSWEATNKSRREKLDRQRMHRQEESEKRIDALFNGREIGYADINVLEEEFRQTEARAQLDEERQELDDYIAKVFNPLDERLQKDISALQAQYDSALGQLDHENNKIKNSVTDKYNLSHTMKTVNKIYQKLEARYQKRLEIALDREHRRKKTERRPLVFMGDSVALKQLDREFDEMEKRNVLEAAKDRDERANRLMDSFDDAIMHGLGENQSLLDDVSAKLSKVDVSTIRSSSLPDSEIEHMLKSVYNLVDSLRQDSESILHNFGIADSALNDADYGVSVAEARYSNADDDVFGRLEDDKKKEDAKIQTDLKSKLDSVRAAPAEIAVTINNLLESLGKAPITKRNRSSEPAPAGHPIDVLFPGPRPTANAAPKKPDEDLEHQERLRRALENAKKRNAARNTPQPPS